MSRTKKDDPRYRFRRPLINKPEQKFKSPKDYNRSKTKRCDVCGVLLREHGDACFTENV